MVAFINARIMDAAEPATVHIRDGVITAIDGTQPTRETIDCGGRVVLPGLIEPHLHLGDALLDLIEPNDDGTLAKAIEITARLKRAFTAEGLHARIGTVLDRATANGTTMIRAHTDRPRRR